MPKATRRPDPRRLPVNRWLLAFFVAVAILLAGVVWLYVSPFFRVGNVEVEGSSAIDPAIIAEASGVIGQNMLKLRTSAAESSVAQLPLIKSVQITRRWPHTVRIRVEESRPWGYWLIGDQGYVIDSDGDVLQGVFPPSGAPSIREMNSARQLLPGDKVDREAVRLAQRLREVLPQALGQQAAPFEYSFDTGLTVITDKGHRATFGDDSDFDYKLAVWMALLDSKGRLGAQISQIDLRFGNRPALH